MQSSSQIITLGYNITDIFQRNFISY